MASEKVVSKLDDLDELAQFLVEKVSNIIYPTLCPVTISSSSSSSSSFSSSSSSSSSFSSSSSSSQHHLCTHQMSLLAEKDMRQVDRVFQMALCEFHANLVSNYSLSLQVHTNIHAYIHTYIVTYVHTHSHTHTQSHTHTHTFLYISCFRIHHNSIPHRILQVKTYLFHLNN